MKCYGLWMCALLASSVYASAQQAESTGSTTTLHVQTQLVVLDTVVTDAKGKVVQGLTKDDFTVYENGAPQTIRSFTPVAEQPVVPAVAKLDHNGHEDWGTAPLTMIVVDAMDTPFQEVAYVRNRVKSYLKMQPAELLTPTILLWVDDDGIHPLTKFTRDRDSVMLALQKQPAALPSRMARGDSAEQVGLSLAALRQAALFSRGQSGKKLMIWVGRSFPSVDPTDLGSEDQEMLSRAVKSTVDLLLSARMTLYMVDPTDLVQVAADVDSGTEAMQMDTKTTVKDPMESLFNMSLFVNETGGKFFRGNNDLDQQIADSETRGREFYTLTYVPSVAIEPGAYRKIDVRLKTPGLVAQTRNGYYGEALRSTAEPTKFEAKLGLNEERYDLYEASVNRMQYTGLGLHVISCAREQSQPRSVCILSLDTGTLTFSPSNEGKDQATFVAVMASLDAKGKLLNGTTSSGTLAADEKWSPEIRKGLIEVKLRTVVPFGTKTLRVVVRDASGRIGTAEVPASMIPPLQVSSAEVRTARQR